MLLTSRMWPSTACSRASSSWGTWPEAWASCSTSLRVSRAAVCTRAGPEDASFASSGRKPSTCSHDRAAFWASMKCRSSARPSAARAGRLCIVSIRTTLMMPGTYREALEGLACISWRYASTVILMLPWARSSDLATASSNSSVTCGIRCGFNSTYSTSLEIRRSMDLRRRIAPRFPVPRG